VETTKQKEETRKNLSPRNMKAWPNINTALLKSVAEIGTMKEPECHEEQQKDVALIHVAHPPRNADKE
jgi:hypothetical protein